MVRRDSSRLNGPQGCVACALCVVPRLQSSSSRMSEILDALVDDDWQVRVAAATEIETVGSDAARAVPALIHMLEAEPPRWIEHKAAIDALRAITGWGFQDVGDWQRWWREQCLDQGEGLC
jgi:HEAT repeat protein